MITRTEAQKKHAKVTYQTKTGQRPWLSRAREIRLTGETTPSSAFVRVTHKDGTQDTAWVGFDSLTLVDSAHQATIDALTTKRVDLLNQVAGIDAAIAALEALD